MLSNPNARAPFYEPITIKYPTMQIKDSFDVVTTVVAPILLLSALGLSIYFALRPLPPLVPVIPDYSFSLPLLVCTASGGVSSLVFIVQIVRYKSVKESFENFIMQFFRFDSIQMIARRSLHPGGRTIKSQSIETFKRAHEGSINYLQQQGYEQVTYTTRGDGCQLSGYWLQNEKQTAQTPTVIFFHGNDLTADTTAHEWLEHYRNLGYNLFLAEYRGYAFCEGKEAQRDQEIGAYLDAEAAYKFVLGKGIEKELITTHGYSLGGAYASALGYFFGVQTVVLERTFTRYADVFSHATPFSVPFAEKVVAVSYDHARVVRDREISDSADLVTDGFNSLAKIEKIKGEVFVIISSEDKLMDVEFGHRLVRARYPDDQNKQRERLAIVDGAHGNAAAFFKHKESVERFDRFMTEELFDRIQLS